MIDLHAATVLMQWATGGLFFCWITTRHRIVSLGYGWLLRGTFAMIAGFGVLAAFLGGPYWPREIAAIASIVAALVVLVISVVRKRAGVSGQREVVERRSTRVAEMTGIDRDEQRFDKSLTEFDPRLDLIAPTFGLVAIVMGAIHAGGPLGLGLFRVLAGAALMGALSDAMLLGHWYLTQPGLPRGPILELVKWNMIVYPFSLASLLIPTGMVSVLTGTVDDGYEGFAGWFWVMSAVTTFGLLIVTRLALKERQYSAVMAATGLLYLAILMGFVMDIVGRILLDG